MSVHEPLPIRYQPAVSASDLHSTELHRAQEELRAQVGELRQQVVDLSERLREAEKIARERDRLREQLGPLKQRLAEASRGPSGVTVDPDEHARLLAERDQLANEHESLLDELEAEITNRELLQRERDELREEMARLETQVATLEADGRGWFALADSLSQQLDQRRQDIEELELLAEESMAQSEQHRKFAAETEQALEEERKRNEALQVQLVMLSEASPAAASTHASGAAEAVEMTRLLREIAKTIRRPPSPSADILAGLRGLRQDVQGLADRQDHLEALIATRLGPEPTTGSILPRDGAAPAPHDLTTTPDEHAPDAAEVAAVPTATDLAAEPEPEEQPSMGPYTRIELAWLAGLKRGSSHERSHFLRIADKLRRSNPELRDDTALLQGLDTLRARFGDGFEYCLLDAALAEMHRPALNVPLLTMKMRTMRHGRRRCH